jgi:hypothetical protein
MHSLREQVVIVSETIRLIADITSLIRSPSIVDGEISSTGKTISAEHLNSSYRLDADTILSGGYEHRSSWTFELYTKQKYIQKYDSARQAKHQSASSQKSVDSIPEPTHNLNTS